MDWMPDRQVASSVGNAQTLRERWFVIKGREVTLCHDLDAGGFHSHGDQKDRDATQTGGVKPGKLLTLPLLFA